MANHLHFTLIDEPADAGEAGPGSPLNLRSRTLTLLQQAKTVELPVLSDEERAELKLEL